MGGRLEYWNVGGMEECLPVGVLTKAGKDRRMGGWNVGRMGERKSEMMGLWFDRILENVIVIWLN